MIAYVTGNAEPIYGSAAHATMVRQMFRIFPDVHVHNDPYPVQFGSGDWITVITRTTGTFTGEMVPPDGTVVPPTGQAFDLDFGQTSKWQGDQLIAISAFWDSALQGKADPARLRPRVSVGSRRAAEVVRGRRPQSGRRWHPAAAR